MENRLDTPSSERSATLAPRTARSRRGHGPGRGNADRARCGQRPGAPPLGQHRLHDRLLLPAHGPSCVRRRADEERRHARGERDQRRRRHCRQADQPLDPRHGRDRSGEDQDEPSEARQRQGRRALRGLPDPVAGLDGHQGQLRRAVPGCLDLDRPGQADPGLGQVREHLPDRPARVVLRPRLPGLPEQRQEDDEVEAAEQPDLHRGGRFGLLADDLEVRPASRRPSRAGRSRASRRSRAARPTGRPRPRRPRTPRPPS